MVRPGNSGHGPGRWGGGRWGTSGHGPAPLGRIVLASIGPDEDWTNQFQIDTNNEHMKDAVIELIELIELN